jgi:FAD synthase
VRVEWLEFLRREKKFATRAALQQQIARDCVAAKKLFKKM